MKLEKKTENNKNNKNQNKQITKKRIYVAPFYY